MLVRVALDVDAQNAPAIGLQRLRGFQAAVDETQQTPLPVQARRFDAQGRIAELTAPPAGEVQVGDARRAHEHVPEAGHHAAAVADELCVLRQ